MAETPFGGLLLAARDQRFHVFGDVTIAVIILGMQNLFDKERPEGLDRAYNLNGLFRCSLDEPAGIHQQVILRSHLVAGRLHQANIHIRIFPEHSPAELDRRESLVEVFLGSFAYGVGCRAEKRAGVCTHLVPPFPAQQNVDGLLVKLAHDVPQSDIDGGNGLDRRAAPAVVNASAVHLVPEAFDFKRILSHNQRSQPVESLHAPLAPSRSFHGRFGHRSRGLHIGVPCDAGIGRYPDDSHVCGAQRLFRAFRIVVKSGRLENQYLDVRNLHASPAETA